MEVDQEIKNVCDALGELEEAFSHECSERQNAIKSFEESLQRLQEDFNARMDSSSRSSKQILSKLRRLRGRQESLLKLASTQSSLHFPSIESKPSKDSSMGKLK